MPTRVALAVLAVGPVLWFALVALSPVLPPLLGAAVYGLGGIICHQLPDRSFHWHGAQLAVCARCTGIYLGACASIVVAPLRPSVSARWIRPPARIAWLLGIAAVPMAVTLVAEWTGLWAPASALRAATGVLVGAAGAVVVTAAVRCDKLR
jgi:uncharacterized membrane protein